jgi:hypothetical protein
LNESKKDRVFFYREPIDMDQRVYRIFPRPYFEEALRTKRLTFVRPDKWQDPWDQPRGISLFDDTVQPWRHAIVKDCEESVYAQCWSRTGESDTLWRAYSRVKKDEGTTRNVDSDEEGVQVSTVLQKLSNTFNNSDAPKEVRMFIGGVIYQSPADIEQWIANQVDTFKADAFLKATETVSLLLRKRRAFEHESEIRCFIALPVSDPTPKLFSISFEPNELFDSVAFDPRLSTVDYRDREESAKALGYNGVILPSDFYVRRLYEIPTRLEE